MKCELKDGGFIHYEVHGDTGDWLMINNGLMMNTTSWYELKPHFSRNHRLLLFDFRDQLQSSKLDHLEDGYTAALHSEDMLQLLDHLKIDKVNMFGVSYGGQCALDFASKYQDRLDRLMLMSIGPKASRFLVAIGDAWDVASELKDAEKFFALGMPFVYGPDFYETHQQWLKDRKEMFKQYLKDDWFDALIRLSKSAKKFDYTDSIDKIECPTLCVCGDIDQLTSVAEMKQICSTVKQGTMLVIPDAAHGAILERQRAFATAILGYMANDFRNIPSVS